MNQPQPLNMSPMNADATKPKGSALAVTAVVLSSAFFVPLAGLVGLVLGIVTLATGRNRTMGIVAVCLGAFFTFFVGIEIAIAIPAFKKYVRRAKTVEATLNVTRLGNRVLELDAGAWSKLADSDWTPAGSACAQPNHQFAPDATAWQAEPWHAIGFSVDDASHYQYRVQRNAHGFLVEAQGDLDCNGVLSHFSRQVAPDGLGALHSKNEIE